MSGVKKLKRAGGLLPQRVPKWAREAENDWSLPPGLLVELRAAVRDAEPRGSRGADFLEAAALAFRRTKRHGLKILLITKKRTHRWGIPKGKLVPHLGFAENAAKEAFEEAGVIGCISPDPVVVFRASKRTENPLVSQLIEVWVYLLEVTAIRAKWPEKGKRQICWVSCETAARELREPSCRTSATASADWNSIS